MRPVGNLLAVSCLALSTLLCSCNKPGATTAGVVADMLADPADEPADKPGSDWPGFLGPFGNGTSAEKGILAPWPEKGPRIVWHVQAGEGYCVPSISQGRLFLFDRHGGHHRLTCMKSTTGESLWKFEYPTDYVDSYGYSGGPRCCPVIDGDRVYIHGPEGMLHCLDTQKGEVIWKVDTKAEFNVAQNFFGVGATPVIEGDLLIAQVGGCKKGSEDDPKPAGSAVVAFDKRTGKVKYAVGDELASYASPVLATIGERRWCFVFARGGLLGFDPATGKIDFHYPWRSRLYESANAANPVVVGNRVLISETYGPGSAVLDVKPGEYKVVWTDADKRQDKSLQAHWCTPIHHDGYVYGDSARHPQQAELHCVELATGKVLWREPGLGHTSLLMVDGHFIGLTEGGLLLLLKVNPKKYEEISRVELRLPGEATPLLRPPCWAAPILSHGLLYVRSKDRLVCLEIMKK